MNAKIYEFADYTVEVIHNPSHNLPKKLQAELVAECTELSRNSFGNPHIEEEFVRHCILESSTTVFGRDYKGQLFGYTSNRVHIVEQYCVIYLQSIAIMERYKGTGLRRMMHSIKMIEEIYQIRQLALTFKHILIAVWTQSPMSVQFLVRELDLFPKPNGFIDHNIKRISKKIVNHLYGAHKNNPQLIMFDEENFVERGAYQSITQIGAHGVYPLGIPFCHNDDEINDYMKQHLNWQNGDALILLGHYREH